MEGFWAIFFLGVILKIPVGLLLYLVWWAFRANTTPSPEAPPEPDEHRFRRFRREPKRPRGPRRGDHGPDALPLPGGPRHERRTRILIPPAPARAAASHAAERGAAEPAEV